MNQQLCVLVAVGRHCEVHQMTGNYMWDPSTNKSFDIGVNRDSLMSLWWNGSEPLWVTLTKAKRKVYMYYWPGECLVANTLRTSKNSFCLRTKPWLGKWDFYLKSLSCENFLKNFVLNPKPGTILFLDSLSPALLLQDVIFVLKCKILDLQVQRDQWWHAYCL